MAGMEVASVGLTSGRLARPHDAEFILRYMREGPKLSRFELDQT